jgi:putative flippase GtrA
VASRFVVVGALGFVVQLVVFSVLLRLGCPWLASTVVAVESAIAHNFLWHRRWTWRHRIAQDSWLSDFVRFNTGTAFTSIAANVGVMAVVLHAIRIDPILANVIAVGVMSVANFLLADRWVFRRDNMSGRADRDRAIRTATAVVLMSGAAASASAAPSAALLSAWDKYVADRERSLERDRLTPANRPSVIVANGQSIDVGSGTITDWQGAVYVPQISLDRFLERLTYPGTPPPQEDVVASRVLDRGENSLSVYMRLVRRAIVTVTYDTDHEMAFHRWSPTQATARSIATRIEEVGGDDHGFLWRLHSYWRYEEDGGGVIVRLDSLTLSRDVPWVIKPIAGPIASRIARESMIRTLEALKRYLTSSLG